MPIVKKLTKVGRTAASKKPAPNRANSIKTPSVKPKKSAPKVVPKVVAKKTSSSINNKTGESKTKRILSTKIKLKSLPKSKEIANKTTRRSSSKKLTPTTVKTMVPAKAKPAAKKALVSATSKKVRPQLTSSNPSTKIKIPAKKSQVRSVKNEMPILPVGAKVFNKPKATAEVAKRKLRKVDWDSFGKDPNDSHNEVLNSKTKKPLGISKPLSRTPPILEADLEDIEWVQTTWIKTLEIRNASIISNYFMRSEEEDKFQKVLRITNELADLLKEQFDYGEIDLANLNDKLLGFEPKLVEIQNLIGELVRIFSEKKKDPIRPRTIQPEKLDEVKWLTERLGRPIDEIRKKIRTRIESIAVRPKGGFKQGVQL